MHAYHFSSYYIVCCKSVHVYCGSFVNELSLFSLYVLLFLVHRDFYFFLRGGGGQTTRESTRVLFKILFQYFFRSFFLFTLYNAFCLSQETTFYLSFVFLYASCCFVDNLLFLGNNIGG